MLTKILIMRPDESREADLPHEPGYDVLRAILTPLLDGGLIERVRVLADFAGGTNLEPADMFVDELGHIREPPLPRNEAATMIYRRAALRREPGRDPETLPFIVGPAVLFSRKVWF